MIVLCHGRAEDHLQRLTSNSIDSMVVDPPAGVGICENSWDRYALNGTKGRVPAFPSLDANARNFIESLRLIFAMCLRAMKPGAHGLVWALPRTAHRTAIALELAGFEVRDVIVHRFDDGRSSSMDAAKAIDAQILLGRSDSTAIKEVNDEKRSGPGRLRRQNRTRGILGPTRGSRIIRDEPATAEGRSWLGWGTGLRASAEFWILIRKPLSEPTLAANVLRWGAGALNLAAVGDGRHPANVIERAKSRRASRAADLSSEMAKAHPTPKSVELVERFVRMLTPTGGVVLDPFAGTFTTGVAAVRAECSFVGIEADEGYFKLGARRMRAAAKRAGGKVTVIEA